MIVNWTVLAEKVGAAKEEVRKDVHEATAPDERNLHGACVRGCPLTFEHDHSQRSSQGRNGVEDVIRWPKPIA